jgi:hypothetical protein
MPLETSTYISDLVSTNPLTTDPLNQADDHLRLIKSVLKTTLPNANAAITATPTNLNNGYVPVGGIIMWSGSVASIPAHWALCNGASGTPDLRNKFVIGAGSTYAPGATGGSATTSSDGAHTHSGNTGSHSLTESEVPHTGGSGVSKYFQRVDTPGSVSGHSHTISSDGGHTHTHTPPYYALAYIMRVS